MKKWTVRILRPIVIVPITLILFRWFLRPSGELCAIAIRRRWPDAWFSSFIIWDADFLALAVSIVIAVAIIQYASNRYLN